MTLGPEYENIGRAAHEMRKLTRRLERLSSADMAADFQQAIEFREAFAVGAVSPYAIQMPVCFVCSGPYRHLADCPLNHAGGQGEA